MDKALGALKEAERLYYEGECLYRQALDRFHKNRLHARAKELQSLVENNAHWREFIKTVEQPGRIEMEFPDDPLGSVERFRTIFLGMAREREPRLDDELWQLARRRAMVSQKRVENWAQKWNLRADPDWVVERARNALLEHQTARLSRDDEAKLDIKKTWWKLPCAVERFSPPEPSAWHPDRTTRQGYIAYVNKYMDAMEELARKAGMTKAPLRKHDRDHFEWLIRHRIMGETYAQIQREAGQHATYPAVRKAIRELEAALGLPHLRDPQ